MTTYTNRKYFTDSTNVVIMRSVGGDTFEFTTTYGEAKASGDLSNHGGTVHVTMSLAPSEFGNFAVCYTAIRYDGQRAYLEYFDEGTGRFYTADGRVLENQNPLESYHEVYTPGTGWNS